MVNDERIAQAEESLCDMLAVRDLHGKRFLDVGSGSGLFSLAARRLGATVHSFDYDSKSIACTRELKRRYLPDDSQWSIEEGSVLDRNFLTRLGQFDVVYSWGVLSPYRNNVGGLGNYTPLVGAKGSLYMLSTTTGASNAPAIHHIKLPQPCQEIAIQYRALLDGRTANRPADIVA